MIIGLLLIVGMYGISIVMIHAIHRHYQKQSKDNATYCVIVTSNNQLQIEWYLRVLLLISWLRGRSIDLNIFDNGSTDDTLAIARKFAEDRENIHVKATFESLDQFIMEHRSDQIVYLKLNNYGVNEQVPIPQW